MLIERDNSNFDIFGNNYNCEFDEQSNPCYSDKKQTLFYTNNKVIQVNQSFQSIVNKKFKNNFAYSFSLPHLAFIKYEIITKDPNYSSLLQQIINTNQAEVHAINGFKFFGSLQDGEPYQGQMIYDYKNTLLLNGQPEFNQPYFSKIIFGNGLYYEGELLNGYFNGHGIFGNNSQGKLLEGEFNNDVFIKGKIYYQKIDKCNYYDGDVKLDVDSQTYLRHGFGTLYFRNGDSYQGWFNEGLYQGLGHLSLHDGSHFSGNFINGLREGEGLYTNSTQQLQFKGTYCENKRYGNGIENLASGECYEGEFQNNVREGQGILKFAERHEWDKYSGEFLNGKMHGEGILIEKNGKTWKVKMYKSTVLRKKLINQ